MGLIKKIASRGLSLIFSVLLGKKIRDPTQGYRALSARVYKNLRLDSNMSISQEMLLKVVPRFDTKEINIKINQRRSGKSFINIFDYFRNSLKILFRFYFLPKIYPLIQLLFSERSTMVRKFRILLQT